MQQLRSFFFLFLFSPLYFLSQVANDLPCNPQFIGTLPYPNSCPTITNGDSILTIGTTIGAISEPLTYALQSCTNGGDINSQSPDVWFKFIPTAEKVQIKISGLGTTIMQKPGLSVFHDEGALGQCMNLIPLFCDIGSAGTLTTNVSDLIPGEHYYLQVRGCNGNTDVGNFKLYIQNANDCIACAQDVSVTSSPLPVAGYYLPNSPITFSYKLQGYRAVTGSSLKAVVINFPPGMWDTTGVAASAVGAATASGTGNWIWANGSSGPGFYYDQNGDGNVNNDAGDGGSQNATWIFRFTIYTKFCTGTTPQNLELDFTNLSDGVYFNNNLICNNDPAFHLKASTNCCALANVFPTSTSCLGICDGSVTSVATTFNSTAFPLSVAMFDAYGNLEGSCSLPTFSTTCSTSGTTCAGSFNVLITDAQSSCVQPINVQVIGGGVSYSLEQTEKSCSGVCANKAALTYAGTPPAGTTIAWKGPFPSTSVVSTSFTANSLCAGWYHVFIASSACSTFVDSVEIVELPPTDASFSYPEYGCITNDTIHPSYVALPGGTFSFSGNPISLNPTTGDVFVTTTTPANNYDIVYTTPGPCVSTSTVTINLVNNFDAGFTWSASEPFCQNLLDTVYANPYFSIAGTYTYTPVNGTTGYLSINSVTGEIDLTNSTAGDFMIYHSISLGTVCDAFYADTITVEDTCATGGGSVTVTYNGISPNGDGFNDLWIIPDLEFQENLVIIYNRYGTRVWETNNYNNSTNAWNGRTNSGAVLPSGTYFYLIRLKGEGKTLKGWIELTE